MITLSKANRLSAKSSIIFLVEKPEGLEKTLFNKEELNYIEKEFRKKKTQVVINRFSKIVLVQFPGKKVEAFMMKENLRKDASKAVKAVNGFGAEKIVFSSKLDKKELTLAFIEGMMLAGYQFLKYFGDKKKKENSLKEIVVHDRSVSGEDILELENIVKGVVLARNLINEPLSFLTANQLAEEIKSAGKEAGFKVEVFEKKRIESLKMGGLLAVNRGSMDPPTFSVLEYKPKNARNKKPYVLVGKGIVFDTGGLSLKPTAGSMDAMKSDMSGAAAVAGAVYSIAKNKLPVYVIGLVPATDNRPGQNAYAPQDVIKMYDGTTVEVLNTDAEGRMILADALGYAKQYKPELTIDLATLTGAAAVAVGRNATVAMGTASKKVFSDLTKSGENVYERLVIFPSWEEYGEQLKSSVADLKNIGGREAGAITAGKFLEHFTDYPWIHLDIAGPAYIDSDDAYRTKGGTGVGVRLLYDFLKKA